MTVKALGLLSGGLDSILAAMLLKRAGVEVAGLCLVTPFFDALKARQAAQLYDIALIELEVGQEHLEQVVKAPRYGYGSNMNPCIDCHAYMFKKAGQLLEEHGYDFLFSGEVLGQRPMSQNANALKSVAKASGYGHLVLRPLSAQCLAPTAMEQNGLVARDKLAAIQGRGRKMQMELARALGVHYYPPPAGGCLLTDPGFSRRLRDLFNYQPQCAVADVELLKYGRHFRLSPQAKLVVGRNQADNHALAGLLEKTPGWKPVRMAQGPGPLGVYVGDSTEDAPLAAALLTTYGAKAQSSICLGDTLLSAAPLSKRQAQEYIL